MTDTVPKNASGNDEAPKVITVAQMLRLKVQFVCAPPRWLASEDPEWASRPEGSPIVHAPLWHLLAHSDTLAHTVADCSDSIASGDGVRVQAPGIPADAVRTVLDVLKTMRSGRMWASMRDFKPVWTRGSDGSVLQVPAQFDWVDCDTYRFLDMFCLTELKAAVDSHINVFPTAATILARDSVSPTNASWASREVLSKLARMTFLADESTKETLSREALEGYMQGLSGALLARVLSHIAFDARYAVGSETTHVHGRRGFVSEQSTGKPLTKGHCIVRNPPGASHCDKVYMVCDGDVCNLNNVFTTLSEGPHEPVVAEPELPEESLVALGLAD